MHIVPWLLSEKYELSLNSCLKNVGCTLVLSGECGLYFGSVLRMRAVLWFCLENAGCALVPVWRMRAVLWFCLENASCALVLSGECGLYFGSVWKVHVGCNLFLILRMWVLL